jgi:hypothetical protein
MSSGSRAVVVELDQVAGRVANVELHYVTGQQHERAAKRAVIAGIATLCGAEDGHEVLDGDPKVVVTRRGQVALEQVQLGVPEGQPLHG